MTNEKATTPEATGTAAMQKRQDDYITISVSEYSILLHASDMHEFLSAIIRRTWYDKDKLQPALDAARCLWEEEE